MSGPILPLNALTLCYMAIPTIVATFLKHFIPPKNSHLGNANRPELKLDEAFTVARSMVQKLSQYSIEDVQRVSMAFQPAPWNVRVIRVSIPSSTCSSAAEYLITAFGSAEIHHVIGGRQWWQLRSNKDGSIEGEWIAMKRDLPRSPSPSSSSVDHHSPSSIKLPSSNPSKQRSFFDSIRNRSKSANSTSAHDTQTASTDSSEPNLSSFQSNILDSASAHGPSQDVDQLFTSNELPSPGDPYEEDLDQMPCMLYIHGGGYYFGSINTHRYTIWRYARKMGGRAFAVNYRLAPQYPFPCALADCLAAYLFLIQPPSDAKHRPIDPSKIVVAGDSAGGGLTLALLTLIRDVGLPMPAGAVLISPWVDLTHSFPSIMSNAEKDIIPPYGFMHQPSVLWPPPLSKTNTNLHPTLPKNNTNLKKPSQSDDSSQPIPLPSISQLSPSSNSETGHSLNHYKLKVSPEIKVSFDESDNNTPILELDDGEVVVMNQQIQFYSTNDQLTHPYCSPLFSPSLGGLPPLLIIAGQNEVLRDEIIYLAHRAANPDRYPLREDLLNANPQRKNEAGNYPPTQVHLQVYDDMFHVLPLFSFLRPAKYCYRAIGSFCKFVTGAVKETHIDSSFGMSESPKNQDQTSQDILTPAIDTESSSNIRLPPRPLPTSSSSSRADMTSNVRPMSIAELPRIKLDSETVQRLSPETLTELKHTIYHASLPNRRPEFKQGMIRERVALDGKIRPLEDEAELEILRFLPEELGIIKAGPLRRWSRGRSIWNQKFLHKQKKIQLQRDHQIRRSDKRYQQSLKDKSKFRHSWHETGTSAHQPQLASVNPSEIAETGVSADAHHDVESAPKIQFGSFLSESERPPPCSVAARDDNVESLKLAKVLHRQRQVKSLFLPSHVAT